MKEDTLNKVVKVNIQDTIGYEKISDSLVSMNEKIENLSLSKSQLFTIIEFWIILILLIFTLVIVSLIIINIIKMIKNSQELNDSNNKKLDDIINKFESFEKQLEKLRQSLESYDMRINKIETLVENLYTWWQENHSPNKKVDKEQNKIEIRKYNIQDELSQVLFFQTYDKDKGFTIKEGVDNYSTMMDFKPVFKVLIYKNSVIEFLVNDDASIQKYIISDPQLLLGITCDSADNISKTNSKVITRIPGTLEERNNSFFVKDKAKIFGQ